MFKAGIFNGMDIIVRSHAVSTTSRPAPGFGTRCLNIDGVNYTFSGAPSHQRTPWAGLNALEAVIHLFNNIDGVRSSMRPEARVQGVITEGGAAPNVVPDHTVADFYIRYPDAVYLAQVREFVDNAARAATPRSGEARPAVVREPSPARQSRQPLRAPAARRLHREGLEDAQQAGELEIR